MNSPYCLYCFILYDDSSFYGLQGVLEGLSRDLNDFYFVKHIFSQSGEPCRPHYHCIGRVSQPVRPSYFHKKYNIPLACIEHVESYEAYRKYMDDCCFDGD